MQLSISATSQQATEVGAHMGLGHRPLSALFSSPQTLPFPLPSPGCRPAGSGFRAQWSCWEEQELEAVVSWWFLTRSDLTTPGSPHLDGVTGA